MCAFQMARRCDGLYGNLQASSTIRVVSTLVVDVDMFILKFWTRIVSVPILRPWAQKVKSVSRLEIASLHLDSKSCVALPLRKTKKIFGVDQTVG